jgi:hypothetical protein
MNAENVGKYVQGRNPYGCEKSFHQKSTLCLQQRIHMGRNLGMVLANVCFFFLLAMELVYIS